MPGASACTRPAVPDQEVMDQISVSGEVGSAPTLDAATPFHTEHVSFEDAVVDDAESRAFLRAHAFLYVPLADLALARDALKARLVRANPLFVDLDEDDP